jgi:hypothetical protein
LERAISIFPEVVAEPVRLIESYNELGCVYRAQVALMLNQGAKPSLVEQEQESAIKYLTQGMQRAEGKNPVLYVDSCEDLAQVFFQSKDLTNTEVWLNRASEAIPNTYKIQEDMGLQGIVTEERIEEFWRQMGKIEILRGHLVCTRGLGSDGRLPRQALEQAVQHYAFAAAYFARYSEHTTGLQTALVQIYDNLMCCKRDDLEYAQSQVLPRIAATFHLETSVLSRFFEGTLGLALRLVR